MKSAPVCGGFGRHGAAVRGRVAHDSAPARTRRPYPTPIATADATTAVAASGRWWLLRADDDLAADAAALVRQVVVVSPAIATTAGLARAFTRLVRERDVATLQPWIEPAAARWIVELAGVVAGMRQDRRDVSAALRLPWSTGPVEGNRTRLKLIKR